MKDDVPMGVFSYRSVRPRESQCNFPTLVLYFLVLACSTYALSEERLGAFRSMVDFVETVQALRHRSQSHRYHA